MADAPYRPLNVRDALSYLDQVKLRFNDQPEVYNRFLDVMKEFKGQIIDTPGVIDRVSTLFRGHPALIQGFNTFLPPGYRIECFGGDGDMDGMITVTTPSGIVSQRAGGITAAMDQLSQQDAKTEAERLEKARRASPSRFGGAPTTTSGANASSQNLPPLHSLNRPGYNSTSPGVGAATGAAGAGVRPGGIGGSGPPGSVPIPPAAQHPTAPSGPSTPSAAHFLASAANMGNGGSQPGQGGRVSTPMLEFNHAIAFVNKIKTRFRDDQSTYKQFLEILQTYQRDTRDINEVFDQVNKLFATAPDLIDEFKKFLPEHGGPGLGMGLGSFMQAAQSQPPSAEKSAQKRGSKDVGAPKRRRGDAKRRKNAKADSPDGDDDGINLPAGTGGSQTLASPEEVAFFDKVKKFIDDKVTYHEFLKLINLFVQDFIDVHTLVERAESFIGNSGDVWAAFKKMVQADDISPNPMGPQEGYGFGGMINIDNQVVDNTPMLERVKPDMSSSKARSYGPSYRKLPQSEINVQCTGRDAMCWTVLNDEWVSHPTWAAEDAAPFMAHKKNAYEEALHKSEEERHEYDYHIEANLRTIALFEPLNNKIQTMDPEERSHFNLRASLGGQSKSIYQRIIKKVYGKEIGPDVIRALHDNPATSLPIVLERLKAKDEEWKKAQREWNRVWREQDAKNFYKALDHQGVAFKASDKKILSAKSLISEIEAKRREQQSTRVTLIDSNRSKNQPHYKFDFSDTEVLKDVVKLVISYLDRITNSLSTTDKDNIENRLRDFVPLIFMLDKEEFDAEFGNAEHDSEGSEESDMSEDEAASAIPSNKKKNQTSDLRKKLLKSVGAASTPGPDGEEDTRSVAEGTPDRGETPLPVPADPEAVAEAIEKDKATADASEQTWVQIETPKESRQGSEDGEKAKNVQRKANFFANTNFYVLIRLIQILYERLKKCKDIAAALAQEKTQPINPVAVKLGLADPETQNFGIEAGENPAQYYYQNLLSLAEKLFENELDMSTFEETLRFMFGTKAYVMFTLDRVVAAIVKQTQTILGDMKSQELFALLQRDRAAETTTTRQQIAYRMQAESVLGPDYLFKVEHHADETITINLLGREDLTIDDAETATEKWKQYIESFVLTHPTEGLPHRVDRPFLQRNLADLPEGVNSNTFDTSSGLDIKVALGNYKMFFTPESEDYFHRKRSKEEVLPEEDQAAQKERLVKWVNEKVEGIVPEPETEEPEAATKNKDDPAEKVNGDTTAEAVEGEGEKPEAAENVDGEKEEASAPVTGGEGEAIATDPAPAPGAEGEGEATAGDDADKMDEDKPE